MPPEKKIKPGRAILTRQTLTGGSWDGHKITRRYREDKFEVRVMAVAEGYAMVRCKRATPIIVTVKELSQDGL